MSAEEKRQLKELREALAWCENSLLDPDLKGEARRIRKSVCGDLRKDIATLEAKIGAKKVAVKKEKDWEDMTLAEFIQSEKAKMKKAAKAKKRVALEEKAKKVAVKKEKDWEDMTLAELIQSEKAKTKKKKKRKQAEKVKEAAEGIVLLTTPTLSTHVKRLAHVHNKASAALAQATLALGKVTDETARKALERDIEKHNKVIANVEKDLRKATTWIALVWNALLRVKTPGQDVTLDELERFMRQDAVSKAKMAEAAKTARNRLSDTIRKRLRDKVHVVGKGVYRVKRAVGEAPPPPRVEPKAVDPLSPCAQKTKEALRAMMKAQGRTFSARWSRSQLCEALGMPTEATTAMLQADLAELRKAVAAAQTPQEKARLRVTRRKLEKRLGVEPEKAPARVEAPKGALDTLSRCHKKNKQELQAMMKAQGRTFSARWSRSQLCIALGIPVDVSREILEHVRQKCLEAIAKAQTADEKAKLTLVLKDVERDMKRLKRREGELPLTWKELILQGVATLGATDGRAVTKTQLIEVIAKREEPEVKAKVAHAGKALRSRLSEVIFRMPRIQALGEGKYRMLQEGEKPVVEPEAPIPGMTGPYPDPKLPFADFRKAVATSFAEFAYPPLPDPPVNACKRKPGTYLFDPRPHQHFVASYVSPDSSYSGLLLWQEVGTGKSCTSMLTWSKQFLSKGNWQVIWVTRKKLKNDPIQRDMFHDLCLWGLRQHLRSLPAKSDRNALIQDIRAMRMRGDEGKLRADTRNQMYLKARKDPRVAPFLSLSHQSAGAQDVTHRILTYREFANLCRDVNAKKPLKRGKTKTRLEYYDEQLKAIDPKWHVHTHFLNNTLLIIDEAHNLYSPENLPDKERLFRKSDVRNTDDITEIEKAIHAAQRRDLSVRLRLLLLTATPVPRAVHMRRYFDLLNLLIVDPKQRYTHAEMMRMYSVNTKQLSKAAVETYRQRAQALVSYVGAREPSFFAQRVNAENVRVPLSSTQRNAIYGGEEVKRGCVTRYDSLLDKAKAVRNVQKRKDDKLYQTWKAANPKGTLKDYTTYLQSKRFKHVRECMRQRAHYAPYHIKHKYNLNLPQCEVRLTAPRDVPRGTLMDVPIIRAKKRLSRAERAKRRAAARKLPYSTNGDESDESFEESVSDVETESDTDVQTVDVDPKDLLAPTSETEESELDIDISDIEEERRVVAKEVKCYVPKALNETQLEELAPKINALLDKIEALDAADAKRGTQRKHAIFTDMKSRGIGSKLIAAAFAARGYPLVTYTKVSMRPVRFKVNDMEKANDIPLGERKAPNKRRVGFLSTSELTGHNLITNVGRARKVTMAQNNQIATLLRNAFNQRDNMRGQKIGIVVLDSGFKEGVDLKDVSYFHLLEPPLTRGELRQAVGRVIRRCGHQNKLWHKNKHGWFVNIYTYRAYDAETKKDVYVDLQQRRTKTEREMGVAKELNVQRGLRREILKLAKATAVDEPLTREIHKPLKEDAEEEIATVLQIPE